MIVILLVGAIIIGFSVIWAKCAHNAVMTGNAMDGMRGGFCD